MAQLTPGRILLEKAVPEQYRDRLPSFNGKTLNKFFTELAKEKSPDYATIVKGLGDVGREAITYHGREASLSLTDLDLPPKIKAIQNRLRAGVSQIKNDPNLDSAAKTDKIYKFVSENTKDLDKTVMQETEAANNSFTSQINSGAKGAATKIRQMLLGNIFTVDATNRVLPIPSLHGYAQGFTPMEYWAASHGARQGYVALSNATADAGYFSRQLTGIGHRQMVTVDDCKTKRGMEVDSDDPDNEGALLASPCKTLSGKIIPAGTLLTPDMVEDIQDKKIKIRSAVTCDAGEGLCSRCAGLTDKMEFPEIGAQVGKNAVSAFMEPITQSAISSKHAAGDAKFVTNRLSGFQRINQFFQMPESFQGGAAVAQKDGRVDEIVKAPQGGMYIKAGEDQYHVPQGMEVSVKPGQNIYAGDVLSDGDIDMSKVLPHKHIGETRRIFTNEFRNMLEESGAGTHRRNLEILARGYVNKVRVTDPRGVNGHIAGDVADYDKLTAGWEPRDGFKITSPEDANNMYLEKPELQYSIGTRINKPVIDTMRAHGINKITAHTEKPPFEPYMVSAKEFISNDEDFITQLAGEHLKRTLVNDSVRGADTSTKGTSYYPRLAMPDISKPLTVD